MKSFDPEEFVKMLTVFCDSFGVGITDCEFNTEVERQRLQSFYNQGELTGISTVMKLTLIKKHPDRYRDLEKYE